MNQTQKLAAGTFLSTLKHPDLVWGLGAPAAMGLAGALGDKLHNDGDNMGRSAIAGAITGLAPFLTSKGLHRLSPGHFTSHPGYGAAGLLGAVGAGNMLFGSGSIIPTLMGVGGTLAGSSYDLYKNAPPPVLAVKKL